VNLEYVNTKCLVSSCFMTDNGRVFQGVGYKDFFPLISEMEFKPTTDIKMIHGGDVCNNIETYDANASNKKLNQFIKEQKKIDVTSGDISIVPTQYLFNFTDFDIVCYDHLNFPSVLPRLESKTLKDMYRGNIVIMTVYRLPTPSNVTSVTGIDKNYLDFILQNNQGLSNTNIKLTNFLKVIQFANESWQQLSYMDNEFKANSIKVTTFSIIHQDAFNHKNRTHSSQQFQDLYINEYDLVLSRESVFQYKNNPAITRNIDSKILKDVVLQGTKYIYLIDRENRLGDRYYNIHSEVTKIPRLSMEASLHQPDGLYTGYYDSVAGTQPDAPIPLDEIDKLDFIYKTMEEAKQGADKSELYNQQLRDKEAGLRHRELELNNSILESKRLAEEARRKNEEDRVRYESEGHVREIEIARLKQEGQRQEASLLSLKRELESRGLKEKTEYETNGYGMRHYFEERKYRHDDARYEHESFIETIKTVAATAGVLATGFMIYKQLSKAS